MNHPLDVRIEKLVYGGEGLARIPSPDGRQRAVFIPFVLPGERVRIALEPPRRGRTTAKLLEVMEPAPDRITPKCEYFGRCGGCQLQHASPKSQLELKQTMLLETLQRTGGVVWAGPIGLHAAEPWGYRNRIRVHAVAEAGVGYRMRESHHILPVTHCPIASPEINRGLAELTKARPERNQEIELAVNNREQGLESDSPLEFEVGGRQYRVSSGAFFQTNRFLAPDLVHCVTEGQSGGCALDLFSGVGLFALPLAESFRHLEAVETSPAAADDLRFNSAGCKNVQVVETPVLTWLQRRSGPPVDLVVADPPRAGLGPEICAQVAALQPQRLHYVSCDPATLGRDVRVLLAAGYSLESLDLFDLFPQTYHIETVAKLNLG